MTEPYLQTFTTPAKAADFAAAYPGLATRFRFGTQKNPGEKWPDGSPVTMQHAVSSRTFPGIQNVQADGAYDPAQAYSPRALNGFLFLDAYRPRKPYSADKPFYGAMVSPVQPFLYGRVQVRASLPHTPGTWPAIYLFAYDPVAAGEIDFMEHYGGPVTVMSQGKPFVVDRVGKPFSTVHMKPGAPASNAKSPPVVAPGWHTYGGCWTPDFISAEIDGREVWRTPNPGLHKPMWLIVTLDVSPTAGDPAKGAYPASMIVQSIRVDPLAR